MNAANNAAISGLLSEIALIAFAQANDTIKSMVNIINHHIIICPSLV